MKVEYIIIQAGGKGTRMEYLTRNKPKALVPINNIPMIFHAFRKFKNKKFIIIGDYKCDVLKSYLETFAEVKYIVVDAKGANGTCGGLSCALELIPDNKAFLLMWSDLVLSKDFKLPDTEDNYVGLSTDFECRWTYKDGEFNEKRSVEYGVAGFFIFKNKGEMNGVPQEGEFVRWLQSEKKQFKEIALSKTREYGLISEYNKLMPERCRPFNRITMVEEGKLLKEGIDKQGRELAIREQNWYRYVAEKGFKQIPHVYSFEPFIMERVDGKNIFEYADLDIDAKKAILQKIVETLDALHIIEKQEVDYFSIWDNYYTKTFKRLRKIQNMVPFALDPVIVINGKKCRNIFFHEDVLTRFLDCYKVDSFSLIHGDCTFSNMMLRKNYEPVLIDPRGYFGYCENVGDQNYDWAKIYYSIKGDYDQFNLKRFNLEIDNERKEVLLRIQTNGWQELEEYYFELIGNITSRETIKMLHAIIWLSLTTYAWEDYDSICGAFYNGLLYFEEAVNELS